MIPLAVPNLAGNEARYLQECIDSNFVSSVGPFVDKFESEVARASGFEHAVAVSSGTAGLHVALIALGVGPGDLVVLPSYTFIASANAIRHCGADPWLLDICKESWTLSPDLLAMAFASETIPSEGVLRHRASGRRVAAVMPVYTVGGPADMDPIVDIARDHGVPVIADAAAALGSRYRERDLGNCGADLSVFSFNGNKTVTCGGGGAVAGNDAELCKRVKHLSTTARSAPDYSHDEVGFNYRMTNLQAAVGCAQLEQLETFLAAKRSIAASYTAALCDLHGVGAFPDPEWSDGGHWMSGITLDAGRVPATVEALRAQGIGAGAFWKPVHLQVPYSECARGDVATCDALWSTVLVLPCSTQLRSDEVERIVTTVRGVLAQ